MREQPDQSGLCRAGPARAALGSPPRPRCRPAAPAATGSAAGIAFLTPPAGHAVQPQRSNGCLWRVRGGPGASLPVTDKPSPASASYLTLSWWSREEDAGSAPNVAIPFTKSQLVFLETSGDRGKISALWEILSHSASSFFQNKMEKLFPVETTAVTHVANSCFQRTAKAYKTQINLRPFVSLPLSSPNKKISFRIVRRKTN